MPRIRIESTGQFPVKNAPALMDGVMDAVAAVLALPEDDRNISFTAYPSGMFVMKPPYRFFIEILLFSGRTASTKKKLYRAVVTALEHHFAIPKEQVMIFLNEQPRGNWGIRGGCSADEVALDFSVDV